MNTLFILLFLVSLVCLVVGLIKPTAFSRFIKGELTRKRIGKIFGISAVALFVLVGITTDSSKKNDNQSVKQPIAENTQNVINNATTTPVVENKIEVPTPTPTKTETKTAPVTKQVTTPTPTPAPTQVKQTDVQNTAPVSTITVSQKNAVQKAKSYLNYTGFSHDGLVAQLEYEQFSHADAVYGADNSGANWNEQAAKKAKSYMAYSAFSRGSLIEQLKFDKFTQEQAEYGANAVGL